MSLKELISILHPQHKAIKSIYDTPEERYNNGLRSTRKCTHQGHKTTRMPSECDKKEKRCRKLNSTVYIKRLPTSVLDSLVTRPAGQKKLPKKDNSKASSKVVKSKSQMDDFLDTDDFMGFSGMEDSAFQLAKYLESNDSTDQLLSPNVPNAFDDSMDESELLDDLTIDELLDMTIKDLEMALPKEQSVTNSRASNDHGIGQRNVIDKSSKRYRKILSDLTEPMVAPGNTKTLHYNPFSTTLHERRASRASVSRAVNETPNSTAVQDTRPTHVVKDTRPTQLKSKSNNVSGGPRMTKYIALTKNNALNQQIDRLFNRPCHKYLKGRCCGRICKWNHHLPTAHDISDKLLRLPNDNIVYMYSNFVSQSNMPFVAYFPTMCDIFGQRKMESVLTSAVRDCEKRENIPFLKFVFNGLVMTGLSKRDALTMVANKCSKTRDFYDVILEILIETDALYFIDKLKEYYLHGTISMDSMYKLLQQVIDNPDASLLTLFVDIIDKYSIYGVFDEETSKSILPRVKNLVLGNPSLSQKFNRIVERMQ